MRRSNPECRVLSLDCFPSLGSGRNDESFKQTGFICWPAGHCRTIPQLKPAASIRRETTLQTRRHKGMRKGLILSRREAASRRTHLPDFQSL